MTHKVAAYHEKLPLHPNCTLMEEMCFTFHFCCDLVNTKSLSLLKLCHKLHIFVPVVVKCLAKALLNYNVSAGMNEYSLIKTFQQTNWFHRSYFQSEKIKFLE